MTAFLSDEFKNERNPFYDSKQQSDDATFTNTKLCLNKARTSYEKGLDLYAMIAQSAYNNNYEDNLENFPPGTVVELEDGKHISGKGKDYEIETTSDNSICIDWYDLVPTNSGEVEADKLEAGMQIISSEGTLTIKSVSTTDNKTTIIFE